MLRRWKRALWRELPLFVTLALTLVLVAAPHLALTLPRPVAVNIDEGYLTAFAMRLLDGHMLPYVDAVSQRGPVLYWLSAILTALTGVNWLMVRLAALATSLATVLLAFLGARRAGHPLAAALATIAFAAACLIAMWPLDGIAFNGELLLDAWAMGSLWALVAALDPARPRPSVRLLLVAGLLAAMGALSKQVGALTIVPMGLWVAAAAATRPGLERRARWRLVGAFALGVAIPLALVAGLYLAVGEFGTLIYMTFTFLSKVYMSPFTPQLRREVWAAWLNDNVVSLVSGAILMMWGLCQPLLRAKGPRDLVRAYDEQGFVATVAFAAGLSVLAAHGTLRDWGHYYVQAVPWCGLLFGLVIERALGPLPLDEPRGRVITACVLLPAVVIVAIGVGNRTAYCISERARGRWRVPADENLCRFVQEHSRPDEKIFVWGFRGDVYVDCHRRPASRYVFTTVVAGLVTWFNGASKANDDARAMPGSRETLVRELEQTRAPVIVDLGIPSLGNRPMRRYELLARYLDDKYCPAGMVGEAVLYLRKQGDSCAPPTAGAPPSGPRRATPLR
jgi:hypothetical protein